MGPFHPFSGHPKRRIRGLLPGVKRAPGGRSWQLIPRNGPVELIECAPALPRMPCHGLRQDVAKLLNYDVAGGDLTKLGDASRPRRYQEMESMTDTESVVLSKVPEITLGFWIIKIFATTLGEVGGS
jgi:hypothetical protein